MSFEIWRSTFDGCDGRSAPFPRFEIRFMNSTAVACFEIWSDDASLLLWFLLMVRSVGLLVTIALWTQLWRTFWSFSPARTHRVCLSELCPCAGRMISLKQHTCLYWKFSKATVSKCLCHHCHALVLLLIQEKRRTLIKLKWNFAPKASIGFKKFDCREEHYIHLNHACLL